MKMSSCMMGKEHESKRSSFRHGYDMRNSKNDNEYESSTKL